MFRVVNPVVISLNQLDTIVTENDDARVAGTHCAAPEVHRCSFLLQRARCKHIVCTDNTAASAAQPSSTLGVDEGLGRQVIRARCLQPGRTTAASSNVYFGCRTQLLQQQQQYPSNSFCFTIVGVGHRQQRSICWLGFNYTTVSGFAQRNHCPDSSGYSYTRKQQNPQKTCRGS